MLRRALMWVSCLASGCGFVRNADRDAFGFSYSELSALIADMQKARAGGMTCAQWVSAHEAVCLATDSESWDVALGEIYARRASSIVREAPVVSLTGTWVSVWTSGFGRSPDDSRIVQALYLGLGTPLCVPFDLVIIPVSFTSSLIQDLGVAGADYRCAMEDLERARSLGCLHPEWRIR
jgi:hypothetical protein